MAPKIGAWQRVRQSARVLVLTGLVVAAGGAAAFLAAKTPAPSASATPAAPSTPEPDAKLRRDGPNGVRVPDVVVRNMALKTSPVPATARPIQLPPLQGRLAVDTNRLSRVHARFAGEVMSLAEKVDAPEPGSPSTPAPRPVQLGDAVRKGDLLAVVWSSSLGEKKSELVDALSKLRADNITLTQLRAAYQEGSVPERSLRDAERAVEADRIAADRAERTLRSWRLTDEEVAAVRAEADRLGVGPAGRFDADTWARVEVRSPRDGVVLEKNVEVGNIVDTSADLFKVGDMSQMLVWVHVYEEDLPLVQSLPKPVRWEVRLPARPGVVFAGKMEQVAAVIDPNQHTALVTGRVENPHSELKAGQFVTVNLTLPAPGNEVELPAGAAVEDGRESVVFVQPNPADGRYVRTPVKVTRRFRDGVCVQADGAVKPGDLVVTSGALLLRDAMELLPAQ
ncbi:MAG TPA: efflux RND transporter periplasmic adaptor subunit [Urbifossiella sp.]|nr:efflux RND transporter periplasmic adaptor subunit [Urbifossiella sp.]